MSKRLKCLTVIISAMLLCGTAFSAAAQSEDYRTADYIYDTSGQAVSAPQSYALTGEISRDTLGLPDFGELADMDIGADGKLYLLDTELSRILVLDSEYRLEKIITEFENGGNTDGFNKPLGICVSDSGNLYIADTDNGRVVILDKNGKLAGTVGAPDREESQYSNEYKPAKVEADRFGRIYVLAQNQTQGIFSFSNKGEFTGYVGATEVKPNIAELFFRSIASKSQKSASLQFVPTEYSNLVMDKSGFLYCVISSVENAEILADIQSKSSSVNPVRRLNQDGTDISVSNGEFPQVGDLVFDPYIYGTNAGASNFADVAAGNNGIYSVLDSKRGRVFTYDEQGNLLYIFGSRGDGKGEFNRACALVYNGDKILVADRSRNTVQIFAPTEYASLVNSAIACYNSGDYEKENQLWQEIKLKFCGSSLAFSGIGRYQYNNGNYKAAMAAFKTADNRRYYSLAVKKHIEQLGRKYVPILGYALLGFAVLFFAFKLYRKKHPKQKKELKSTPFNAFLAKLKYSSYVSYHPFDGFWDLKYEGRGNVGAATVLLILATAANTVFIRFKAFTFNTFDPLTDNAVIKGAEGVALLVLLWCAANWSMTTLMDGKGTMKDIYCYMCYSLRPVIILMPAATAVSYVLPLESAPLLNLITGIAVVWTAFLIFCGTATTHQYSAGKTVGTIALTVVGMLIILFLFVLTVTLIQQMIAFISLLAKEITMRA